MSPSTLAMVTFSPARDWTTWPSVMNVEYIGIGRVWKLWEVLGQQVCYDTERVCMDLQ